MWRRHQVRLAEERDRDVGPVHRPQAPVGRPWLGRPRGGWTLPPRSRGPSVHRCGWGHPGPPRTGGLWRPCAGGRDSALEVLLQSAGSRWLHTCGPCPSRGRKSGLTRATGPLEPTESLRQSFRSRLRKIDILSLSKSVFPPPQGWSHFPPR